MWSKMLGVLLGVVAGAGVGMAQTDSQQEVAEGEVIARLALVADPHLSNEPQHQEYNAHFEQVIQQVNQAGVDAVLLAGDLTQRGDEEALRRFARVIEQFNAPCWSVAGNHDVGNKPMAGKSGTITAGRLSQYERLIGPSFYAEPVRPGVRLVAFNASLFGSGLPREAEQWTFLEQQLDKPEKGVTLLFSHYPLFVSRPDEPDDYFNINPEARQRLLRLIERGGVQAVLTGHLHRPIAHTIGGVRYLGAPAVSFGLPRGKQPVGWQLLTLKSDGSIQSELRYLAPPATQPVSTGADRPQAAPPAPAGPEKVKELGPIAVLPAPDENNYVFEYFRKKGSSDQLHVLSGQDVIDPQRFNVERYRVCLYLGSEQFVRSVQANADVERALRSYGEQGGVLVVLSTGPYPFYLDEKGIEVISGSRFGLSFLGNEENDGDVMGFDDPPVDGGLRFAVHAEAFGVQLPAELAFPAEGDQRWRPLVRTALTRTYHPWISLRDRQGRNLGEAAAWVGRSLGADRQAWVAYASHLLTQRHPQRDQVLDGLFAHVAGHLQPTAGAAGAVSDRVHVFYYNWYGAPPHQEGFVHWQQGGRVPPEDIGSNFYPKLGAYSSSDPGVLKQHMAWIRQAGIGVLSLSWWGRNSFEEKHAMAVLDAAAEAGLKVNFHLEPYAGMNPQSLEEDVKYLLGRYGQHPAFYRAAELDNKPLFYVFETLRHPAEAWRPVTQRLATSAQPVLLIAQTSDLQFIQAAGFDGGYPYDVLTPFKNERFLREWTERLDREFAAAGKLFIPSVGPGYWDDRAVPAGADEPEAARTRDGGTASTYQAAWRAALSTRAPIVTITSFNEWHEGSQIEPAVAKEIDGYHYPPYAGGEYQYLRLTAEWARRFAQDRADRSAQATLPKP